jgi:hypothetical protein
MAYFMSLIKSTVLSILFLKIILVIGFSLWSPRKYLFKIAVMPKAVKKVVHMNLNKTWSKKIGLAGAICIMAAMPSHGIEFVMGDIEATFDSQLSVGSSWRMEKQDSNLAGDEFSPNGNDGDANYNKGYAFSQVFKGSHDLQISYDNFGALVRAKYWYDSALESDNALNDSSFHELAQFSGVQILDAFVYGEFEMLDMPLDLRLGKQVLSWGESTFIFGGINSINPIDVVAFRRPGAEIKEGLIPVNMAFASLGLSENLSAEAFYQLDYQETIIPGCGTYFATNDYAPEGCLVARTPAGDVFRNNDEGIRRPNSDGQFGVALRYFSESLDTEFGFYAMNIHNRIPVIGGVKATLNEQALLASGALNASIGGLMSQGYSQGEATVAALASVTATGSKPLTYYVEYPEDLQITGISFATNVGSMALSGEVIHKLNVPIQVNATELLGIGLQADGVYAATVAGAKAQGANDQIAHDAGVLQVTKALGSLGAEFQGIDEGGSLSGGRKFDVSQAQLTVIQTFDQVLGSSRYSLVAEAGYTFIHDFNTDTNFSGNEQKLDTVTENSWGYRMRITGEYNDVFSGVNLAPVLAFSHDVNGVAPAPGGNFIEGQQSIGVTLNAEYLNTYTAAIAYTQYLGGISNQLADRDFASLDVGVQF